MTYFDHWKSMNKLVSPVDKAIQDKVSQILASPANYDEKYNLLDQLWFTVVNHHRDGMAADVLEVVSAAQTKVLSERR